MNLGKVFFIVTSIFYCGLAYGQNNRDGLRKVDSIRKEKLKDLKLGNGGSYVGVAPEKEKRKSKLDKSSIKQNKKSKRGFIQHGNYVGVNKMTEIKKMKSSEKREKLKKLKNKEKLKIDPNDGSYIGVKPYKDN
ncbi:hypothetical protein OOZ15_05325 [Galbibacter sp. EGI 63066]|uniref:hypothetical protein n=1 Tax=Galbibacter sp. EGI 63066 TaxID=2993559 RepID=UPI0022499A8E|nr:hypothetical protein [Galbibacter sp. EGI 63066]MCX2679357.1 hypothetical protein [Galbibacter sp. EGI 63066]